MQLDNLHEITTENSHAVFDLLPFYYWKISVIVTNYETINYKNYDSNLIFDIHVKIKNNWNSRQASSNYLLSPFCLSNIATQLIVYLCLGPSLCAGYWRPFEALCSFCLSPWDWWSYRMGCPEPGLYTLMGSRALIPKSLLLEDKR